MLAWSQLKHIIPLQLFSKALKKLFGCPEFSFNKHNKYSSKLHRTSPSSLTALTDKHNAAAIFRQTTDIANFLSRPYFKRCKL